MLEKTNHSKPFLINFGIDASGRSFSKIAQNSFSIFTLLSLLARRERKLDNSHRNVTFQESNRDFIEVIEKKLVIEKSNLLSDFPLAFTPLIH